MVRRLARLTCRLGAWLPVLLALHLAGVQAAMLPSVRSAAAPVAREMPPMSAMHCHDMADTSPEPVAPPADHCDPGHCHCPVAMAQDLHLPAGPLHFSHRIGPLFGLPGKASVRQAPDLRPPIAS